MLQMKNMDFGKVVYDLYPIFNNIYYSNKCIPDITSPSFKSGLVIKQAASYTLLLVHGASV